MRARSIGLLTLVLASVATPGAHAQTLLDQAFTPPAPPPPAATVERIDPVTQRELRGARVRVGEGLVLLGAGLGLGVAAWGASWDGLSYSGTDFAGFPESSEGEGVNQRRVVGFAVGGILCGSIGLGLAIGGGAQARRIRSDFMAGTDSVSTLRLTLGDGHTLPVTIGYSLRF